jgi:hypothetical protein
MEEIRTIISDAIRTAFVDYPTRNDGSQWDQTYKELAECEMLANAVLIALNKKGFAVTKVTLGTSCRDCFPSSAESRGQPKATQRLTARGKLDVIPAERHKSADLSQSGGLCVLFETMIQRPLNPRRK